MSPRAFDSDEECAGLWFTEYVECPDCGHEFEGDFYDDSMSVEDITDPPRGEHRCPQCRRSFISFMTGWTFFSEAG